MGILKDMLNEFENNLIHKWYPLVIDKQYGGYFTNLAYDLSLMPEQEKMIVTQSRHMWTTSKAAKFLNNDMLYESALHGLNFLKNQMWDERYGGFYQIRNREGKVSDVEGWLEEKRTYGNAFAIYGLSALYELTKNNDALELAIETFNWLEERAYDPLYKGYFQFLTREGKPFGKNDSHKTNATDAVEAGYKDQNSSIHLLEAFTELYGVWRDNKVRERLEELLVLIRDKITHPKGYLQLFFERDWTPVSFRYASPEIRDANYRLDHVSFGHDYETAFLMLEASYKLGLKNDTATLYTAKKMLDHAIENGWDNSSAGFFDEGYYYSEEGECKIIKHTKNWWAQAEALNALLLFSKIFPNEKRYYKLFLQEWDYIKKYLIDHEHGDWYWGSLEKEAHYKTAPKGTIWKATYHNGRALMNCILMLSDEDSELFQSNEKFRELKSEFDDFIGHWQKTSVQAVEK
ncbi:N-acylglucosamine 2-epimerase superfamily [Melioribacter roseus P3M-2]|uniref:N-acylglucosamine 2-epimerase superfamily n=1 Tax=Melioribacter roseus (strain DSM 23840 / JCM 17771 / VKM B-2668 / P3M-2) TaxID=1191523 RepID=I6ZNZ3_MELRP|nr:AGE family epimerase/isomerase [Melioribacter roseus]AFN73749.1 N-acylglucosamine 2-epimerase superfamily [Melioribacter roseus P3M-2]